MGRVDGKIAIVTGAASGIGAATADLLAAEGAKVVVADLDGPAAAAHAAHIVARGHAASAIQFDLGDEASIRSLMQQTFEVYGGIDVLHNNAAATTIAGTRDHAITDTDTDVWDETLRVNVRGTALAIKYATPHLLARGGGSIINTSSGAALFGDLGISAYGTSKAAINGLTKYAATQLGKQGIRVNAVAPGLIITPGTMRSGHADELFQIMLDNHLTPRLGDPLDVAYLVLFLASDESTFITGQVIGVDGGHSAHAPQFSDMLRLA